MDTQEDFGLLEDDKVKVGFLSAKKLPLVIHAIDESVSLNDWFLINEDLLKELRDQYGAILFRGFNIDTASKFEDFVTLSSCAPMDNYLERQLKRDRVEGNVFTSTAHPKEGEIFLHNEQSFNLVFPRNIYFNSHTVAQKGGCTPLADTRKIFAKIPAEIKERFMAEGYLYQRNFMEHVYVDWQWAFQTENKKEVEEYCGEHEIDYQWGDEKSHIKLNTKQIRPVVAIHPNTKEPCWCNHFLPFNVYTLESQMQKMIMQSFSENEYPYHTFYGDGTHVDPEVVALIQQIYLEEQVTFDWHKGDVLMVDNLSVAHGRQSFEGERLVLTALSEPCDWRNLEVGTAG